MNREEILAKSRMENEGNADEREVAAMGIASSVGLIVGAVACLILAIASRYWFHKPEIAFTALLVFFAMRGSNDIALCAMLKEQKRLIRGIVEFGAAVAFAVALVMIML